MSQKMSLTLVLNISLKNRPILIIFNIHNPEYIMPIGSANVPPHVLSNVMIPIAD